MLIEITRFRLQPAAETAFREADERFQSGFAYLQPGLLRRTTARGRDDAWVVVTLWSSPADADAARQRSKDDPLAAALWSLVEDEGRSTERYETLD